MSLVTGHAVVDGVPYINGKPSKPCKDKKCVLCKTTEMKESLAPWLCPECGAHLGKEHLICLNACHLSAASFRRFQQGLQEADARVRRRESEV